MYSLIVGSVIFTIAMMTFLSVSYTNFIILEDGIKISLSMINSDS
jgi:hypothetical protein